MPSSLVPLQRSFLFDFEPAPKEVPGEKTRESRRMHPMVGLKIGASVILSRTLLQDTFLTRAQWGPPEFMYGDMSV